ncbi:MAG TPA: hypothetical protein VE866_11105 [Candidatus Binatia bacterium]|jgi:hypothetical protein|nr:hypothetical protein [Candidatus Binatia bacterium]
MLSDSILANAGWLFFAAYSATVAAVSIAAFGGDVLPAKVQLNSPPKSRAVDPAQPAS